jgi:WD40 repeat protein
MTAVQHDRNLAGAVRLAATGALAAGVGSILASALRVAFSPENPPFRDGDTGVVALGTVILAVPGWAAGAAFVAAATIGVLLAPRLIRYGAWVREAAAVLGFAGGGVFGRSGGFRLFDTGGLPAVVVGAAIGIVASWIAAHAGRRTGAVLAGAVLAAAAAPLAVAAVMEVPAMLAVRLLSVVGGAALCVLGGTAWGGWLPAGAGQTVKGPATIAARERRVAMWLAGGAVLVLAECLALVVFLPGMAGEVNILRFEASRLLDISSDAFLPDGRWRETPPDCGVSAVAFSPDGRYALASCGSWSWVNGSGFIVIGDVASGKEVCQLSTGIGRGTDAGAAFSPDSRHVAFACADGTVRVHDITTGAEVRRLIAGELEPHGLAPLVPFSTVAFSADGGRVLAGNPFGEMRVWSADSGEELHRCKLPLPGSPRYGAIWTFTPDGKHCLTGVSGQLRLWDLANGRDLRRFHGEEAEHVSDRVAISADGRLALSSGVGTVHVWDLEAGRVVRQLGYDGPGFLTSLTFSPDRRRVVAICWDPHSLPCDLLVWEAESGQLVGTIRRNWKASSVAVSPSGRLALVGVLMPGKMQLYHLPR